MKAAQKISFKFLSIVRDECERKGINRAELAEKLGVSRAYVTQLFTGRKLLNMATIAKMERVASISFEISYHTIVQVSDTTGDAKSNDAG